MNNQIIKYDYPLTNPINSIDPVSLINFLNFNNDTDEINKQEVYQYLDKKMYKKLINITNEIREFG